MKAKIEETNDHWQEDGARPDAESGSISSGHDHQQSRDAPASNDLSQLMDYQAEMEGCSETDQAQQVWDRIVKDKTVSTENRQSLYQTYQKVTKRLKKK